MCSKTMNSSVNLLKNLPAIDKLLQSKNLSSQIDKFGQKSIKDEGRRQIADLREAILGGDDESIAWLSSTDFFDAFCGKISAAVQAQYSSSLIPVFNLTGTVVHTNLGRASLPAEAVEAMVTAAIEILIWSRRSAR